MYETCSMYSVLLNHGVHAMYSLCEMYGVYGVYSVRHVSTKNSRADWATPRFFENLTDYSGTSRDI
jgi:hypothetical protein